MTKHKHKIKTMRQHILLERMSGVLWNYYYQNLNDYTSRIHKLPSGTPTNVFLGKLLK